MESDRGHEKDLNRNVEGDGDDGVEDNDIGEKYEERNDSGARHLFFWYHCVPREENLVENSNQYPIQTNKQNFNPIYSILP